MVTGLESFGAAFDPADLVETNVGDVAEVDAAGAGGSGNIEGGIVGDHLGKNVENVLQRCVS